MDVSRFRAPARGAVVPEQLLDQGTSTDCMAGAGGIVCRVRGAEPPGKCVVGILRGERHAGEGIFIQPWVHGRTHW